MGCGQHAEARRNSRHRQVQTNSDGSRGSCALQIAHSHKTFETISEEEEDDRGQYGEPDPDGAEHGSRFAEEPGQERKHVFRKLRDEDRAVKPEHAARTHHTPRLVGHL